MSSLEASWNWTILFILEIILGYLGPSWDYLVPSWALQRPPPPPVQTHGRVYGGGLHPSPKRKKEVGRGNSLNLLCPQGLWDVGFSLSKFMGSPRTEHAFPSPARIIRSDCQLCASSHAGPCASTRSIIRILWESVLFLVPVLIFLCRVDHILAGRRPRGCAVEARGG